MIRPLFIRKQFSESKNFLKNCRTPSQKFFGTVRQTFSGAKLWHPFYAYFFDTRIFLKHWRNAHENFRHCETENFWRKNVITLIMHKIFRYPKIFSTLKGFPRKLLALWDKKFSREKRDTTIMRKFSRYHIFSETLQGCSQNFSALRDHIFSTKKWDTPHLFIRKDFSKPEDFSKTVGLLYKNFQHCETNNFLRKMVTPLLCINIFDTRFFLKLWRGVNENFRHCETENFWRQLVIPPIMHKIFRLPQCLWNNEGMPTFFFGTVRPEIFDRKTWCPLICKKISDTTISLTHCREAHEGFRY